MNLLALPAQKPPGVFWRQNEGFVEDVAQWLGGRPVLEIFAGNGYLAALLAAEGVSIRATSLLSGMDAHALGLYHPVEPVSAVDAVYRYGAEAAVLLVSWPTVTPAMLAAAKAWGPTKEILFIGEVTDYAKGHLGGCATDEFFDSTYVTHEFTSYRGNMLEHAQIRRLSPVPLTRNHHGA